MKAEVKIRDRKNDRGRGMESSHCGYVRPCDNPYTLSLAIRYYPGSVTTKTTTLTKVEVKMVVTGEQQSTLNRNSERNNRKRNDQ